MFCSIDGCERVVVLSDVGLSSVLCSELYCGVRIGGLFCDVSLCGVSCGGELIC